MSGHRPFEELASPLLKDPKRRERVRSLREVYEAVLTAGADDRISDARLELLAEEMLASLDSDRARPREGDSQ